MLDAAVALTDRRVVILVEVGLTQECVVANEAAARAMVVGTGTGERVP